MIKRAITALVFSIWFFLSGDVGAKTNELEDPRLSLATMRDVSISADGLWMAYLETPLVLRGRDGARATVVIKHVETGAERKIDAGVYQYGAGGGLEISPDSSWLAFKTAVNDSVSTLSVIELGGPRKYEFPGALQFEFNALEGSAGGWIAVTSSGVDRQAHLRLIRLNDGYVENIDTGNFSFAHDGSAIVATVGANLILFPLDKSEKIRSLDLTRLTGPSDLSKPIWSPTGTSVAAFRKRDGNIVDIIVVAGMPEKTKYFVIDSDSLDNFPKNYRIADVGVASDYFPLPGYEARPNLVWRADASGFFVGVKKEEEEKPLPDLNENLRLWHSEDARIPPRRLATEAEDRRFSYLGYVDLERRSFTQLATESLRQVYPHPQAKRLLAYDQSPYQKFYETHGVLRRDYYLVDIDTGERQVVLPSHLIFSPLGMKPRTEPQLSPDGVSLVYLGASGDYFVLSTSNNVIRNLTASLRKKIFDPRGYASSEVYKNEYYFKQQVDYMDIKWANDSRHFLVCDERNVWLIPLDQDAPRNLTKDLLENAKFGYSKIVEINQSGGASDYAYIDESMYFSFVDTLTKSTGIISANTKIGRARILWRDSGDVEFFKAASADKVFMVRQTALENPDYYVIEEGWQGARRLTNFGVRSKQVSGLLKPRLISYTTAEDDELQGIILLPRGYMHGAKYPAVVWVYERLDQKYNDFAYFHRFGSTNRDIYHLAQMGYVVLLPSYRIHQDRVGRSAVEGISAAVNEAVRIGVVDESRIAITGESFGGYVTNFVVTQTDIFRAAIPVVGVSNIVEKFGSIYYSSKQMGLSDRSNGLEGQAHSALALTNQPYLSDSPWANHGTAIDNSPIMHAANIRTPMLIVHGSKDGRVSFTHSLEMFNAIRFFGKSPVVLLEYSNEGHGIGRHDENMWDIRRRIDQFLAYYLKGEPVPSWWADGVSYPVGRTPAVH